MSNPIVFNQSLTNCLSNDGTDLPTSYEDNGQNLDESGVNNSSTTVNVPLSSIPNSNLVSARMIPFVKAYSEANL